MSTIRLRCCCGAEIEGEPIKILGIDKAYQMENPAFKEWKAKHADCGKPVLKPDDMRDRKRICEVREEYIKKIQSNLTATVAAYRRGVINARSWVVEEASLDDLDSA